VDAIYHHHNRKAKKNMESVSAQEEDDDDEDPKEDVESLQRELQQAEANYNPLENKMTEKNESGSDSTCGSMQSLDGQESLRSSSFIDLQQLLFSSGAGDDENSSIANKNGSVSSSSASLFSSSSNTCRIVEIYETRTTQLKPQPENEKEQVPPERRGVPFRKCRNPSCSCHHPSTKSRDNSSRNRQRNKASIEKYHTDKNDINDGTDDPSTSESRRNKRRSALHRLQKQREKLLAMDAMDLDEDDQTEVTTGSTSSSSRYSGYSMRSECQINTRRNQFNNRSRNPDRGHRRQRSRSEDFEERFTHATSSRGATLTVISAALPSGYSAAATRTPSPYPTSTQFLSPAKIPVQCPSSNDSHRRKQTEQQPPPPLPSRRAFGDHKHTTYPSSLLQCSQSLRKISSDSCPEEETTETARRCRSEDFIDVSSRCFGYVRSSVGSIVESSGAGKLSMDSAAGKNTFVWNEGKGKRQSTDQLEAMVRVTESFDGSGSKNTKDGDGGLHRSMIAGSISKASGKKRSFSAHTTPATINDSAAVPDQEEDENRVTNTTEGKEITFLRSPTCIMEEVHRNDSYPRSRTTQHPHEHILGKVDLIHKQKGPTTKKTLTDIPAATRRKEARTRAANRDDRDDNPNRSRLFDEGEQSLKEYRQSIRILQNEEKMDRRQKMVNIQTRQKRGSRKQQKRRRQQQQQREFQRSMQLADLYHNMGLIHYQQGRFDTARHVLQCGVDALIAHRSSSVPFSQAAFEETIDPFDDDYSNPYFACAPSRILLLLPTLDEAAPHLANPALLLAAELVLAQGKSFAAQGLWNETKQSSGKVLQWSVFQKQRLLEQSPSSHRCPEDTSHHATANSNKYWRDWGPTTARAQVLFARCFEQEHRPDIAMGYYQEALSVQRCVLEPGHVQAADTLYRMGNLYAAAGLLGLAGQCYDEALCLYRRLRSHVPNSAPPWLASGNGHSCSRSACIAADEATVLAGLGWLFLVQHDLVRALALTNEALDGMVHALGSSHRNVLSLRHQLACIQNSLAAAAANANHLPVV
jgi:tetratricopeptide (TPR) repeat protein